MKLATYTYKQAVSCGILTNEGIIDIPSSIECDVAPQSIKQILTQSDLYFDMLHELSEKKNKVIPFEKVKLLAPLQDPGKIFALAGNYSKHIAEAGRQLGLTESSKMTTVPRPFLMPSNVITGPDSVIPWPNYSKQIDYEVELAVVIGKTAKCITTDRAKDHIAGYCIANDISARSVTFKENRTQRPWDEFFDWLNGKWADHFLPIGPYITTADEIKDVHNLNIELKVNGRIRQQANTSQMIFSVFETVSFISHLVTLQPGDIIATGTPEGVAMATGDFLEPEDKIQCNIEKIGTLTNVLGPRPDTFYQPVKPQAT
ncbi:MAG: fumarylacetoacetate hydrolase family protein [Sedimentisphaerales bacterium]|nr:fumarylacetoacetate hydrolase family protein [Sedimentisphaerales bacterium]